MALSILSSNFYGKLGYLSVVLMKIHHYFCYIFPLLKIACTDTYVAGILVTASSDIIALIIFAVFSVSNGITSFTLKKSFSWEKTESPFYLWILYHDSNLFFVPVIFIYIRPPTNFPEDKIFALFCTIIVLMFNQLIYTLRNIEMKNTVKKFSIKYYFQRKYTINLKKYIG